MTHKNFAFLGCLAFLGLAMAADTSPVFAQKIRSAAERRQHPGGGFWANDSASRRISHAQDYSRGLQRYSQYIAQPAQPAGQTSNVIVYPNHEMVTTQVREIGNNIAGAQERLLEVKADATASKDQATLDSLKSINDQLTSAAVEQKKCMEECKSGKMDMAAIMKRCEAMTAGLDKAKAEHDKLMQRLHPDMKPAGKAASTPQK